VSFSGKHMGLPMVVQPIALDAQQLGLGDYSVFIIRGTVWRFGSSNRNVKNPLDLRGKTAHFKNPI